MELREADKAIIAKPVPSRHTCPSFRSFSELLAGAIDASPSNVSFQAAVAAIRPKTVVRFKPAVNHPSVGLVSSQAVPSGRDAAPPSDKVLKPDRKSDVVYKPMAKLVSKTTVALLANMRSANLFQKHELAEVETNLQQLKPVKHQSDLGSELRQNFLSVAEKDKICEHSKTASANLEEANKTLSNMSNGNRPSYDGYNWRKYGQKQVKGSEYPRSYYKCTHPNCPVKKKVERSLDGQIAEIVYRGEHNHPKPNPLKRNSCDGQYCQGSDGNESNSPLWNNQHRDRNDCAEGNTDKAFGFSANSIYSERAPSFFNPIKAGASNFAASILDNSSSHGGEFEGGREILEAEIDEPKSKRRKNNIQSNEAGTSVDGAQEPQTVAQNSIDSAILGDGFRWRKYGQKVVKGNPYPRSYYRCTTLKCDVRKYVERTSEDPNAFITTYEGKHNHEMPIKSTNSVAAKTCTKAVGSTDAS